MFGKKSEGGYRELLEGIEQKTLVYGEKTLMTEFRLKAGYTLPLHSHPYEQTGYLIAGKMTLYVGEQSMECNPGDSWSIPSDAEHYAEVAEDSLVLEVFSPVREDYLPK